MGNIKKFKITIELTGDALVTMSDFVSEIETPVIVAYGLIMAMHEDPTVAAAVLKAAEMFEAKQDKNLLDNFLTLNTEGE